MWAPPVLYVRSTGRRHVTAGKSARDSGPGSRFRTWPSALIKGRDKETIQPSSTRAADSIRKPGATHRCTSGLEIGSRGLESGTRRWGNTWDTSGHRPPCHRPTTSPSPAAQRGAPPAPCYAQDLPGPPPPPPTCSRGEKSTSTKRGGAGSRAGRREGGRAGRRSPIIA